MYLCLESAYISYSNKIENIIYFTICKSKTRGIIESVFEAVMMNDLDVFFEAVLLNGLGVVFEAVTLGDVDVDIRIYEPFLYLYFEQTELLY